jgi:MoaD family protein
VTKMVSVTLRYFASVREALEMPEEKAQVSGGKVIDVLSWLAAHHGDMLVPAVMDAHGRLRGEYRLLHNGKVCPPAAMPKERISDGDEIVLMPPVAGGLG